MTAAELIKLRERLKWSQAEAARNLGCSARSIVNWEKGTSKIPKNIALAAAAVVMNLPPYGK
jgi:DNA-binding transcriptional regulator YiaG